MFHFTYTMTFDQYKEYMRLKKETPKMSEAQLFTAITGSVLCLGKTLFKQLGYSNITQVFTNGSIAFFWTLIIISVIKGIEKNCNPKTRIAGIIQIISSGVSAILMLH